MRHSSPQTVDITAEPVNGFSPQVSITRTPWPAIRQSLGVDIFLIFVSLLLGWLFSSAISAVDATTDLSRVVLTPPKWLIFFSSALPALIYLGADTLTALARPNTLPFARSESQLKAIYARRFHLFLLAFYFTAILVALCWSAGSMLLVSKLFVSAVFAIALYALGQSIPSRRTSFIVSGILFLVVLITTQSFIVLKLDADSQKVKQEVLDGVIVPRGSGSEIPPAQEGVIQRRVVDETP